MMAPIHDRMPAILDEGDALAVWLNPKAAVSDLWDVLAPTPDGLLESRPVSPLVNNEMTVTVDYGPGQLSCF